MKKYKKIILENPMLPGLVFKMKLNYILAF